MQSCPAYSPHRPPRSFGRARLCLADGRLKTLYQEGCLKILRPRFGAEAVVVNTAGGLTGGDRLALEIALGQDEALTLTTQAAERIYRSIEGPARLEQHLRLEAGARLDWLPQETILYNGAALRRRLQVDLAPSSQFLALESWIFGRAAHGEVITALSLSDQWRIHRAGQLIHAEALRLNEMPQSPACLDGNIAMATLLWVAPAAETKLERLRALLAGLDHCGASAPMEGVVLARFLAPSGHRLRQIMLPALELLRGAPSPRVWQI